MKKIFAFLCALSLLLCGCKNTNAPTGSTGGTEYSGGAASPAQVDFSKTDQDMFTDRDNKTDYDKTKCVTVTLHGDTATASTDSVTVSGSVVTITEEAAYLIKGTLDNGTLVVNAPDTAKLQLIFDGVSITSETSAALSILEADKVFLTLAEGSENSLASGGSFVAVDDNNIDGALFSKQDLTINGSGSLSVISPAGHGIVGKDDLVITGGTHTVTAASHGLDANDSVRIRGASLNIHAGKDGIHVENTDDATLGFFYCSGGNIKIEAEGDGISAGAHIQVADGSFDIKAGGGYENGTSQSSGNYGSFMGGMGGPGSHRPGGFGNESTPEDTSDAVSMKGFKSGTGMLLSDGVYTVDTADDAFHSNGDITVNGGSYTIATGDDAFHGETTLTITGCAMEVTQCYEGLEAEKIFVSGGEMDLNCSDDGLNAAGGTDSSGSTGGRDGMFGGGGGRFGGGMMGGSNPNALIEISGGKLTIHAGGDGLDSNGNLTITGGHTTVYNPKSGDTSVLDSQNKPSITGGTYIGLGITTHMAESFSAATSTQGFIACSVGNVSAGTEITVTDSDGRTILSCTSEHTTALVILSCPEMVKGQTYTITAGANSGEITAS